MSEKKASEPNRPRFKVRVVYKSGYTHDFWAYSFRVQDGAKFTWEACDIGNQPVVIGVDEIAAVWQVDVFTGVE